MASKELLKCDFHGIAETDPGIETVKSSLPVEQPTLRFSVVVRLDISVLQVIIDFGETRFFCCSTDCIFSAYFC